MNSLLAQLKDIHMPKAVSFWPLAPGWYVVIGLLMLVLLVFIMRWHRHKQRLRCYRNALQQIDTLEQQYKQQSQIELVRELSIILRRIALTKFGRDDIAGLAGNQWLIFLDKKAHCSDFSRGQGRVLITAPYQRTSETISSDVFGLVKNWINSVCLN